MGKCSALLSSLSTAVALKPISLHAFESLQLPAKISTTRQDFLDWIDGSSLTNSVEGPYSSFGWSPEPSLPNSLEELSKLLWLLAFRMEADKLGVSVHTFVSPSANGLTLCPLGDLLLDSLASHELFSALQSAAP